MKKIMFNDKYGLTKAVLEGRKTQTRRIIPDRAFSTFYHLLPIKIFRDKYEFFFTDTGGNNHIIEHRYRPFYEGDFVAIAQRYSEVFNNSETFEVVTTWSKQSKGWGNKMFVKAECMPHQIKIINVRLERLQDISHLDCLEEGIVEDTMEYPDEYHPEYFYHFGLYNDDSYENGYKTAREAYAALIDKLNGKGTWDKNPWVWVYDFKLVK